MSIDLAELRKPAVIKLVYCVRKRTELSSEAFGKYWLERHAPLARWFVALNARKYLQSYTVEPAINEALAQSRGLAPPYDQAREDRRQVRQVDKAGFIKTAGPLQDKIAKELGPHAVEILGLVRAVK